MSLCAAHYSWVCCSKSTSRMTSYSSSFSRIGSVFSHPLGQNVSTCGTPQIRRHRGGLGMGAFFPLYSVYFNYSTLSRKKQFFSKAATFSVLICVLADIRCQRLRVRHVRIVRLLCLFGSGMARAPPPLLALKKQVNGGSIMIQDELRALYDQMSDEEKNENSVLKGRFTKYITRLLE